MREKGERITEQMSGNRDKNGKCQDAKTKQTKKKTPPATEVDKMEYTSDQFRKKPVQIICFLKILLKIPTVKYIPKYMYSTT